MFPAFNTKHFWFDKTTAFPLLVLRVKSIDCGLILLLLVMGFLSPFTLIASVYNHDI